MVAAFESGRQNELPVVAAKRAAITVAAGVWLRDGSVLLARDPHTDCWAVCGNILVED